MSNVTGPGTAQDRNRLFEQLVDRYQEPVLRMCYYCLCDKTQAEDAVQKTFLKLYRTLDNYRGDCSEKTWIMKIATRVCYDMNHSGWFRFMNRHVTPEMLPAEEEPEKRNDAELAEAVMKLPYKLREVILLYYYQDLTMKDIADTLGVTQPTVSYRLRRAKEKLRRELEGRDDHD